MSDGDLGLERIAIIGMACRLPGARSVGEFWRNLENGVESVTFFTEEELLAAGCPPEEVKDPRYVKASPVLPEADKFDAGFFGMTRREAELLDPQHRLFLELAFQALEDGGYDSSRFQGDIGVYGGVGSGRYGWLNLRLNPEIVNSSGNLAITTSANTDYLATQVSYKLNLRGPSMTVQTACSTSLVAVHLACESLRNQECDMALAGGSSIEIPLIQGYLYDEGGIESPDGHCRAFDASAQGTIWGSGAGVVLLKRLSDAVADGDRVYAVILGTAVNNDGSNKVGFSAPSVQGQAEVITQALGMAGVDPSTISCVEAHGTGTAVGDPMEVAALTEVYTRDPAWKPGTCAIGSVKTNLGHLGPAAGVTGLMKAVLSLHNRAIPPSLNFERPNPKIDFDKGPFYVNASLSSWEPGERPRRAAVSSFGIGGTNAHAILEEAPPRPASGPSRERQLLVLSAKKPTALEAMTLNLGQHLKQHPELPLADLAYTLQVGRGLHAYRRAVVSQDAESAIAALAKPESRRVITGRQAARPQQVVFMFPGQGAQHANMGRELYEKEAAFRDAVDRCAGLLEPELSLDLRTLLYPSPEEAEEAGRRLDETALTQPALFTVEYALATVFGGWGVAPQAMIGHSIGEYVAACLAGVFSLDDALRLVAARGRLMQRLPAGAMLAVQLEPGELEPLLGPELAVAAINGPGLTVASGPIPAIEELAARLREREVSGTRLRTSHAFHSPMMEPILADFEALVRAASPRAPELPFLSNLTGTWITAAEATDPAYWARHLRQAVRFSAGVQELLAQPDRVFVEVGPGRTLSGLVRLQAGKDASSVTCLPHPKEGGSEQEALLQALGRLWVLGVDVDWERFQAGESRQRVPVPGYPLDRQRYWVDPPKLDGQPAPPRRRTGKLPLEEWFSVPAWKEAPLAPAGDAGKAAAGSWLVFEDEVGLAAELRARLSEQGRQTVAVRPGTGFARLGEDAYEVDPARPADYESLVAALAETGRLPASILHAWSVTPPPERLEIGAEELARAQERGFYSLLFTAQALAARQVSSPLSVVVLTSQAQDVTGEELLCPGKATVAGVCRVLPTEMANVTCRQVDVVLPREDGRRRRQLVDQLLAEVAGTAPEPVVALRAGRRWTLSYEPVPLPAAPVAGGGLRERGVYLITGGLGGIGLTLARDLASRLRARLALTARSQLPPREEWDAWLERHGRDDRVSRQLLAVREMEAAGGEVLVLSADVADRESMAAVRREVLERFGELHGIVHAAGVPGGGMIEVKTVEQAAAVLSPKVTGSAVLAAVFGDLQLDFVSLCSSVTAVAGGFGQVDYCGANAFMDALAHTPAFGEAAVTSVDWAAWLEAGMAVETAAPEAFRQLQRGIRSRELDHPLLTRADLPEGGEGEAVFAGILGPGTHWVLDEHRIGSSALLPGTGYLELARAACEALEGPGTIELRDVDFEMPMVIADGERREVRVILERGEQGSEFRIVSLSPEPGAGWQEHARGSVARVAPAPAPRQDLDAIRRRCDLGDSSADGVRPPSGLVTFGPHWSSLRRVLKGRGEELAYLEADETVAGELARLPLHPALLDEATSFGSPPDAGDGSSYLPLAYGRITVRGPLPARLYSLLRYGRSDPGDGVLAVNLALIDADGVEVAEIQDYLLRRVNPRAVTASMADMAAKAGGPASGNGSTPAAEPAPAAGDRPGITLREGVDAFRRLLAWRPGSQVVVSVTDLESLFTGTQELTEARVEDELENVQLVAAGEGERSVDTPYVAPRSELEQQLVRLWAEILGSGKIGIDDDFFALGGNSLVAVQLISRVRSKLGVKLPMRSLFKAPTVAGMAALVESARSGAPELEEPEIVPVPRGS
jgi:phthiocerol/phenolphthiocerol synthesis type-I polyketide synthase E